MPLINHDDLSVAIAFIAKDKTPTEDVDVFVSTCSDSNTFFTNISLLAVEAASKLCCKMLFSATVLDSSGNELIGH